MILNAFAFLFLGCGDNAEDPRHVYNDGLVALNEGRYDDATTTLFDARDLARSDVKLRQYSSYNLALSYAKKGMQAEGENPEEASTQYEHAVTWFRDAIQLNPEDEEARINLEVVLKRIQLLADRLNAGKNGLESRLDRLLDDTRTLRDQARKLKVQLDDGTTVDSLRANFEQLAVEVRSLQAQASTTIQLSSSELGNIEAKAEEQRSDEEKMRAAQLAALSYHLEQGRDQIADARRVLRRTDIEKSLDRLDRAVRTIHRAREQLQDPLAVLQTLAQEEGQVTEQTRALLAQKNPGLFLSETEQPPKLPSWFDAKLLSSEQGNIHERTDEILQRFSFSISQEDTQETQDPQSAEFLALVEDAVPPLASTVVFMKSAEDALLDDDLANAIQQEYRAQQELAKAIERFADAKNLIELAYQTQQGLVMLVTPPQEGVELPVEITAEQRLEAVSKALEENVSRVNRLKGALRREKEKQLQQVPQQEEGGQDEDPKENIEALFSRAEELRGSALASLEAMNTSIQNEEPVLEDAKKAQEDLQQLRVLFFSVVEHLKQLLEDEGTLRDETSALVSEEYERMIEGLGLTLSEQREYMQRAQSIAEVLQQQADVAAQSQEQQGQQQAEALAEAYAHTSTAQTAMADALDLLTQVQQEEGGVSHDPQPALDYQQEAMEALMAAIQALQPPQQNPEQGDDEQEQQEQMSKQQAERRLEAAKEREAERAKKRQEANGTVPVEKDW